MKDVLTLSRSGVVVPEQYIYYDDGDIAYDEDMDDVEWSGDFVQLSLEERLKMVEEHQSAGEEPIRINLERV